MRKEVAGILSKAKIEHQLIGAARRKKSRPTSAGKWWLLLERQHDGGGYRLRDELLFSDQSSSGAVVSDVLSYPTAANSAMPADRRAPWAYWRVQNRRENLADSGIRLVGVIVTAFGIYALARLLANPPKVDTWISWLFYSFVGTLALIGLVARSRELHTSLVVDALKTLAVLLPLALGYLYISGHLRYSAILRPLGLTPEEVGIDYRATLARYWVLPVVFITFGLLGYGFLYIVRWWSGTSTAVTLYYRVIISISLLLMVTLSLYYADLKGKEIGVALAKGDLRAAGRVLGPQLRLVTVKWVGIPQADPHLDAQYIYLGQAGMTTVLLAPATTNPLRIPTASVVVTTV